MSYTNPVLDDDDGGGDAPAPARAAPKTNADFRALLARAPASGARAPRARKPSTKPKQRRDDDEAVDADARLYRDRARERRERRDEEEEEEEARELHGDDDEARAQARTRGVFERIPRARGDADADADADARRKAIDESKYLGGDVTRTHLVKGLDVALLRKVRRELDDGEALKRMEQKAFEEDGREPTFTSTRARAVFEYIKSTTKSTTTQHRGGEKHHAFASGAVSYSFNLAPNAKSDVPTTTRRATDDDGVAGVRALRAYVDPKRDASLLTRLGKLMHYLTLGSEKAIKKFRREERRAAHEAKEKEREARERAEASAGAGTRDADDSDEDIFADVGKDYDPNASSTHVKGDDASKASKSSYFGDDVAGGEASRAAPKAKIVAAEDYVEDDGADDDGTRANAFGVSGDYDECYPGYDVDLDDVGAFDKRQMRDEDEDAKAKREREDVARKKRAEGNEFSKIRSMMKEKFGGKNDAAFETETKKQKSTKQAPKREGDDGNSSKADASSGRHKRLRL